MCVVSLNSSSKFMNGDSDIILTALHCQRQYQAMSPLLIPNKQAEVEMPIKKRMGLVVLRVNTSFFQGFFSIQQQIDT